MLEKNSSPPLGFTPEFFNSEESIKRFNDAKEKVAAGTRFHNQTHL